MMNVDSKQNKTIKLLHVQNAWTHLLNDDSKVNHTSPYKEAHTNEKDNAKEMNYNL